MNQKLSDYSTIKQNFLQLEEDNESLKRKVDELQNLLDQANQSIDSLSSKLNELTEFNSKDLAQKQAELDEMRLEADTANKKIEELLKGGDYADEQLRIHIEEMEDAVEVLKTGKQKWKNNYKDLKDEYDKLKS